MKKVQSAGAALAAALFMFVVGSQIKIAAYQWMQESEWTP